MRKGRGEGGACGSELGDNHYQVPPTGSYTRHIAAHTVITAVHHDLSYLPAVTALPRHGYEPGHYRQSRNEFTGQSD